MLKTDSYFDKVIGRWDLQDHQEHYPLGFTILGSRHYPFLFLYFFLGKDQRIILLLGRNQKELHQFPGQNPEIEGRLAIALDRQVEYVK